MVGPAKHGAEGGHLEQQPVKTKKAKTEATISRSSTISPKQQTKKQEATKHKVSSVSKKRQREESAESLGEDKKIHVIDKEDAPAAVKVAAVAAEELSLADMPEELMVKKLLPQIEEIEDLCAFGATSNAHARLVCMEISRRHPSLLQGVDVSQVSPLSAVLHAKHAYKEEQLLGQKVLLSAIKNSYPEFATCTTLEEVLHKKDLIVEIKGLVLRNPDRFKPMILPPHIGQFIGLEVLVVSECGLTKLPREIGQCVALKYFRVFNNDLKSLPPEIGHCVALLELNLHTNDLDFLPPEIGQCVALKTLQISSNHLKSLPPEIGQCVALRELDIDENELSSLPSEIGQCVALTRLSINRNQLNSLPIEIRLCPISFLSLKHNQFHLDHIKPIRMWIPKATIDL